MLTKKQKDDLIERLKELGYLISNNKSAPTFHSNKEIQDNIRPWFQTDGNEAAFLQLFDDIVISEQQRNLYAIDMHDGLAKTLFTEIEKIGVGCLPRDLKGQFNAKFPARIIEFTNDTVDDSYVIKVNGFCPVFGKFEDFEQNVGARFPQDLILVRLVMFRTVIVLQDMIQNDPYLTADGKALANIWIRDILAYYAA